MGFMPWQEGQERTDSGGGHSSPAMDGPLVRAPIAKGRVREMLARGWNVLDPTPESWTLMEGPEVDSVAQPFDDVLTPMLAHLWGMIHDEDAFDEEWSTTFA